MTVETLTVANYSHTKAIPETPDIQLRHASRSPILLKNSRHREIIAQIFQGEKVNYQLIPNSGDDKFWKDPQSVKYLLSKIGHLTENQVEELFRHRQRNGNATMFPEINSKLLLEPGIAILVVRINATNDEAIWRKLGPKTQHIVFDAEGGIIGWEDNEIHVPPCNYKTTADLIGKCFKPIMNNPEFIMLLELRFNSRTSEILAQAANSGNGNGNGKH